MKRCNKNYIYIFYKIYQKNFNLRIHYYKLNFKLQHISPKILNLEDGEKGSSLIIISKDKFPKSQLNPNAVDLIPHLNFAIFIKR